jgi:predicted site-specific integrase-resolvase
VKDSTTPGFLPLAAAANWAGISTRTLVRWIARGLPKYQAQRGGKVLLRISDIERFLGRQTAPQPDLDKLIDDVLDTF